MLPLHLVVLLLDPLSRDHELLYDHEHNAAEVDVLWEGGIVGFGERAHLKLTIRF
jgi:hypothetical protein